MFNLSSSPISRIFAITSIIVSLLHYLQVVDAYQLYFNKDLIFHHKEIWRLFTSLFHFGPLGFNAIMHIFNFLQYSTSSESSYFTGKPADFLVFSLFGCICMWLYATVAPVIFLGHMFTSYFTYYWSKRSPDNVVFIMQIPFGINAPWVPFVFLTFNILNSSIKNSLPDLFGFAAAHLFFFIHDVINLKFGTKILVAPDSLNRVLLNMFN